MPGKKSVPTEAEPEDARWFEENEARLIRLFEQAHESGALRIGGRSVGITVDQPTKTLRMPPTQKVMLRISTSDLERARAHAAAKGIGYQTYIKMLLHAGLNQAQEAVVQRPAASPKTRAKGPTAKARSRSGEAGERAASDCEVHGEIADDRRPHVGDPERMEAWDQVLQGPKASPSRSLASRHVVSHTGTPKSKRQETGN